MTAFDDALVMLYRLAPSQKCGVRTSAAGSMPVTTHHAAWLQPVVVEWQKGDAAMVANNRSSPPQRARWIYYL